MRHTNGDGLFSMTPVIGSLLRSGDRLNEGNYVLSALEFGVVLVDVASWGYASSYTVASKASTRVFWSGGNLAKSSAADFALANGMKTLEMTITGRVMNSASPFLPRSVSVPIWNRLSTSFAKGAKNNVHFFTSPTGSRPGSIWLNIEKPILQQKGINIISH